MLFRWILGVLWLFGGVPGADFLDDALSGHDVAVVGVGEPELLRWRGCCGELDAFWDASVACRFGEFGDGPCAGEAGVGGELERVYSGVDAGGEVGGGDDDLEFVVDGCEADVVDLLVSAGGEREVWCDGG